MLVWTTPAISSITLPAHAQASCCLDVDFTFVDDGFSGCRTFEGVAVISIDGVNNDSVTVTYEKIQLRTPSGTIFSDTRVPYEKKPGETVYSSVGAPHDEGFSCLIALESTIEVLVSAENVPAQWLTFPPP